MHRCGGKRGFPMDMKAEKVVGLNEWAAKKVSPELRVSDKVVHAFSDGTYATIPMFGAQVQKCKKEEYDGYVDLSCAIMPLHRYTMPDGKVYEEAVQDQPWDLHGLFVFLAFRDEKGMPVKESLWSEQEMRRVAEAEFAAA